MAKSKSPVKFILLIVIVLGLAAGGYYYWKRSESKPPEVATSPVTKGDIIQSVTATGILQAPTSVDVSSQISGQIKEVMVDYNQSVKKGDVLARLDTATYESRLNQAKAQLANTQASYTLTRLNTDRTRDLRTKNLVSQQELDQAEAQLAQAEAQLQIQKANVEDAKVNLDRCTIYAPIDGIVLDRLTEVGKMVAASLNAPTLFTLVNDLTQMEISADVAEADIGSVATGQDVNFTVDAYPGRQFRGKVVQMRNLPKTAQSVVVYATIIEVNNADQHLKPGMTANASIVIARRTGVLKVANAVLRARVPDEFLLKSETASADAAKPAGGAQGGDRREQMRQLMQDAGYTPGAGAPSPEVRAKIQALAKERGIELPENFGSGRRGGGGGGNGGGNTPAVVNRNVYRLASPVPNLKVESVRARFGISDGTSTEVIDGLKEGDTLVTSIFVPGDTSSPASSQARSPFGGQQGFGGPGGAAAGRR